MIHGKQNKAGVGKCPNRTSPYYWGCNIQQVFEGDVQNPQKGTFTNPCKAFPHPSRIRARFPQALPDT